MKTIFGAWVAGAMLCSCVTAINARASAAVSAIPAPPPKPLPSAIQGPADPLSVTPADLKRYGSLYLRCDGRPNNITDAESFARFLGAVTLLALLAPASEEPDPAKRLFAERGVAVCSKLLDDPKEETNGLRRLPLILARAAHRIEAKDYKGALGDIAKARGEAQSLGLVGNPYFERSLGMSFNLLEGASLMRLERFEEAQEVGVRNLLAMPYSFYASQASTPYTTFLRTMGPSEDAYFNARMHSSIVDIGKYAVRLEEVGRYREAAAIREDVVIAVTAMLNGKPNSIGLAEAAIGHALAGDWDRAQARADDAARSMQQRIAEGKPEPDPALIIEDLDFYKVLRMAHEGRMDDARRMYAARSQWTAPSFGANLAANALLRAGAPAQELKGALAKTPDAVRRESMAADMALAKELDKNNRTIFLWIFPYANVNDYERLSKPVWNTRKSRIISEAPLNNSRFYALHVDGDAMTQPDALLLHAALQAKAKGKQGMMVFRIPSNPTTILAAFGNAQDPDMPASGYLDAEAVIAALRKVIPSPEELRARHVATPSAR